MDPSRRGDWMQTFTGKMFWPLDPSAADVDILDIAHSLSLICRYNGQCSQFYSVAEHSWHVSHMVPPEHQLAALMHDAPEAYVCDIPSPLKKYLTNYEEIEYGVWRAICDKWPALPWFLPECVKTADSAILMREAEVLLGPHPAPWGVDVTPANRNILFMPPGVAEYQFLMRFNELMSR